MQLETASPFDTPRLMQKLVEWVRQARDHQTLHPVLIVAVFVVVFLEIHPFQDGNGRLSRVLTTLLLLQAGYAYVPYSSLESMIEQNKQGYGMDLRQTQGTIRTDEPNWHPWVVFFLSSLASQVRRLEEKIGIEEKLLAQIPALSVELIDIARKQGRVTVAQAVELTGVNRNTVRAHLKRLVDAGHLKQHGSSGRGV